MAKRMGLDKSLVQGTPSVLMKGPEERGDFDKIVLNTLVERFETRAAAHKKRQEESEAIEGAEQKKTADLQRILEAASSAKEMAEEALGNAEAERKETLEAEKEAKKELRAAKK